MNAQEKITFPPPSIYSWWIEERNRLEVLLEAESTLGLLSSLSSRCVLLVHDSCLLVFGYSLLEEVL